MRSSELMPSVLERYAGLLKAVDKTERKSRREMKEKFKRAEKGGKDKRVKEQEEEQQNESGSLLWGAVK